MNKLSNEIQKKDTQLILRNKKIIGLIFVVPIVLTIIMPTIFILSMTWSKMDLSSFSEILSKISSTDITKLTTIDQKQLMISFFLENVLPIFFLLIPTMGSSIISSNAFVGEKERETLETLYLSPITVKDIFKAKAKTSIVLSSLLNLIVFIIMFITLNIVLKIAGWNSFLPSVKWLTLFLIAGSAINILSTTIVIKNSKKSESIEEAQQSAVFIIIPIIALVVGQISGLLLLNTLIVGVFSILLLIISIIYLHFVSKNVNYEN